VSVREVGERDDKRLREKGREVEREREAAG